MSWFHCFNYAMHLVNIVSLAFRFKFEKRYIVSTNNPVFVTKSCNDSFFFSFK